MIKGYVFLNQLASNDVDSMIFRKFLNNHDGKLTGLELTPTLTDISISDGVMMIAGRPIGVVSGETINLMSLSLGNKYCLLVAEVDLTKASTTSEFKQAAFKILSSSTGYPTVTQQDMDDGGTLYQVALAKFQTDGGGSMQDGTWVDLDPQLDFTSIYSQINSTVQALIDQLEEELAEVEGSSAWVLTATYENDKENVLQKKITSGTAAPNGGSNGDIYIQYFE